MKKSTSVAVTIVMALLLALLAFRSWTKAPDAMSLTERRPLAQMPELSGKTLLSGAFMQKFETYTLDQFPLRDDFRALKAVANRDVFRKGDNNGYFEKDGCLAKIEYPMSEKSLDYAASRFKAVYDLLLKSSQAKCYLAVIPDKGTLLAPVTGHPALDLDALCAGIYERVPFATPIDVARYLELGDYYLTDTHWRQEQIVDVAEALADAMGVELTGGYETVEAGDFYGVYYGQAALAVAPDKLCYLTNDILEQCVVTSYDSGTGKEIPLYDLAAMEGKDPYELFVGGPISLVTIENPAAATERELIVFRDSFSASLAPLLASGYAKITLVDIRYLAVPMLPRFLDVTNEDVLFLYSTSILNNSEVLK